MATDNLLDRIGVRLKDESKSTALHLALLERGFLCDTLSCGESTTHYCGTLRPAAIVIEPDHAPGTELVGKIRNQGFAGPVVIMLSGISDCDRVALLAAGADDVLESSAAVAELLMRLDFILARYRAGDAHPGPAGGHQINKALTPTERRIFEALANAAPQALSRENIMWALKRREMQPEDRTIDVYVSNIRRKMRLLNAPSRIETVRGHGFRYVCDEGAGVTGRPMSA